MSKQNNRKTSLKENIAIGVVGSIMMGYSALTTAIVLDYWTNGAVAEKVSEKLDNYLERRAARKREKELHDPKNIGTISCVTRKLRKTLEKAPAMTMEELERECAHAE